MGIQELADDHEASSAVRGVILSALGIGRAELLGQGELLSFSGGDNKCNHFYTPKQKVLSRF